VAMQYCVRCGNSCWGSWRQRPAQRCPRFSECFDEFVLISGPRILKEATKLSFAFALGGVSVVMIALHTDVPHRADHPWGDACARLPSPNAQGHRAANDNGLAWPLIPFPINWYAAC
jgi:hypothetical protein